jgi:hypothetical protein
MSKLSNLIGRRRMLKGMLASGAVSVGLPILDCMLTTNGEAFADTGAPIPLRFATWFWGLGFGEGAWVPKATGANYELPLQMRPLEPIRNKMNLFSGSEVFADGHPVSTHVTGGEVTMAGRVVDQSQYAGSLDNLVADQIGKGRRFRSLQVTCSGNAVDSWSVRQDGTKQLAEVSPLALYTRLFGPGFKDPNAADFTPDPNVMIEKSALSAVTDQRKDLMQKLGAADRAKLDAYFTSVRALEDQLSVQLQKPPAMLACTRPGQPPEDDGRVVSLVSDAMERHDLFAGLFASALACGQTNVVNLTITEGMSGLRFPGETASHHSLSHEEPIDPALGYQKKCFEYQKVYMNGLLKFAQAMDGIKEGDKTMLDRMVVFAFTDHGAPRLHSLHNYMTITLGGADGRLKTGLHVSNAGQAVTRVGLTAMQVMGVPIATFGTGSNQATSPIAEVKV